MGQLYVQAYSKAADGAVHYVEAPIGLATVPGITPVGLESSVLTGGVRQITITLDGEVLAVADNGVNGGSASLLIFTFPRALTQIMGANVSLAIVGGAGLTATSAVVGAVGTTATGTDNATLTTTEADIVPSTACTLATNAGTFSAVTATAPALFDGRTTAKTANLNFATPDAGITAATTLTVTGTVTISYLAT